MKQQTTNMGNLFDEHDAELMKAAKAITPEQRAEEERLRKIKWDYEQLHTAFETDEDRADPEKYPPEDEEE
jgi:hypothetical protein